MDSGVKNRGVLRNNDTTKTIIVVRVRGIVVVAIRSAQIVWIIVPRPAAQNANMTTAFLVTPFHATLLYGVRRKKTCHSSAGWNPVS